MRDRVRSCRRCWNREKTAGNATHNNAMRLCIYVLPVLPASAPCARRIAGNLSTRRAINLITGDTFWEPVIGRKPVNRLTGYRFTSLTISTTWRTFKRQGHAYRNNILSFDRINFLSYSDRQSGHINFQFIGLVLIKLLIWPYCYPFGDAKVFRQGRRGSRAVISLWSSHPLCNQVAAVTVIHHFSSMLRLCGRYNSLHRLCTPIHLPLEKLLRRCVGHFSSCLLM